MLFLVSFGELRGEKELLAGYSPFCTKARERLSKIFLSTVTFPKGHKSSESLSLNKLVNMKVQAGGLNRHGVKILQDFGHIQLTSFFLCTAAGEEGKCINYLKFLI